MEICYLGIIRNKLTRLAAKLDNCFFDAYWGLNQSDVFIRNNPLRTRSVFINNSSGYQAVWYCSLRKLIHEAMRFGFKDCMFIDIGCGKGKACFFANCSKNFSRVIGIDFDEDLINEAVGSHALLKKRGWRNDAMFYLADATEYELAEEKILIFMFNPFDEVVLNKFLKKNVDNMRRHNSAIAYANDVHAEVLKEYGMKHVFRNAERKISLWTF